MNQKNIGSVASQVYNVSTYTKTMVLGSKKTGETRRGTKTFRVVTHSVLCLFTSGDSRVP